MFGIKQFSQTTSSAMQRALTSSVDGWLIDHPFMLRLLQILGWATNHPIISLIILLFLVALAWSVVKAIGRVIEAASLSILRVPLKLLGRFLTFSFQSLKKVTVSTFKQVTGKQVESPALLDDVLLAEQNKQQRLAEISARLTAIQQEQQDLLQEAATILALDTLFTKNTDA